MDLYIQIENGQPINHPALAENIIAAFGSIPPDWEPFVRVEKPMISLYQVVNEFPSYEKIDGVWTDNWNLRDMTPVEKIAYQSVVKSDWLSIPLNVENRSAWTFDEATCSYVPPIPIPTENPPEGQRYRWRGTTNSWDLAPEMPEITKTTTWTWDYKSWSWLEVSIPTDNT